MSAAPEMTTEPTPETTPEPRRFILARPPGAVVMCHDIDAELARMGKPAVYERESDTTTLQVFDWLSDPRVLELTIPRKAEIGDGQNEEEGVSYFHFFVKKPGIQYSRTDVHIFGMSEAPKPGDTLKGKVQIRVRRVMPREMNWMGDTYCNNYFAIDFHVESDPEVEVRGRLHIDGNHLFVRDFNDSVLEARTIKHRGQWIWLMTLEEAKNWDEQMAKAIAKAKKDAELSVALNPQTSDTKAEKPTVKEPDPEPEVLRSGDDSSPTMAGLLGDIKL